MENAPRLLSVSRWTKDGTPQFHPSHPNVVAVLENDPRLVGRFRRNAMSGDPQWSPPELEYIEEMLDPGDSPISLGWELISDEAAQRMGVWLDHVYDLRVPWRTIHEAMTYVASRTLIHPLQTYLDGLTWDGVERLDTWLSTYAAVDDLPLTRELGRRWMISAIARALRPGVKADHVLVFQGRQGRGKSSVLGVLGGDWYSDYPLDVHDKQAGLGLRGVWIHELAELDGLSRAELGAVKAFLTLRKDRYRPPYGKAYVDVQRGCVFGGTTNDETFLADPTGNRRFWVVRMRRWADVDGLTQARDQLWAEARTVWQSGEHHHLQGEAIAQHAADVEQYVHDDPWHQPIADWCHNRGRVFASDIYKTLLNREIGEVTQVDQRRVAAVLRRLGYCRRSVRTGATVLWAWEVEKD